MIGDCYDYVDDKKLKPSMDTEVEFLNQKKDHKTFGFYTLQARHDLLQNMSLFLTNYINDKKNEFSDCAKKEAMMLATPLMIRSVTILQKEYNTSIYCSDKFCKKFDGQIHIYQAKIESEADISVEFLKTLGRYYFLHRGIATCTFKMNSNKEQKIISEFTRAFYSKKELLSNIIKTSSIQLDALGIYFTGEYYEGKNKNLPRNEFKILDKIMKGIAGKMVKKYLWYGKTDPVAIHEFCINWFLRIDVFTKLEKRILNLLKDWRIMDYNGYGTDEYNDDAPSMTNSEVKKLLEEFGND
ncbi:MAG: hypothetical protein OER82_09420 [Nitrosopumilus sp.]|nr:hypothetical protein [Nitrosopumilus sp.]